jgi:hypothetical protein
MERLWPAARSAAHGALHAQVDKSNVSEETLKQIQAASIPESLRIALTDLAQSDPIGLSPISYGIWGITGWFTSG